MNFNDVATGLSAEVYQQLKIAIEIGRWRDGKAMTPQQRQISMEAILLYEFEHLPPEQRTGYIPPKIGSTCDVNSKEINYDKPQPIRWKD